MGKLSFKADPLWVVKSAIDYYMNFLRVNKYDKSKRLAIERITRDLSVLKAESMLEKLIEKKGEDYAILSNIIDDGYFLANLITETEQFKVHLRKYKLKGNSGRGVYDKSTDNLVSCEEGHHKVTLEHILKVNYPKYYNQYESFLEKTTIDTRELDNFIEKNFTFV